MVDLHARKSRTDSRSARREAPPNGRWKKPDETGSPSHLNTSSTPSRRSYTTSKRRSKQRPPPRPLVQDEDDAIASEWTSSYEPVKRSLDVPPMQGTIDQQPIILDATPRTTTTGDKVQPGFVPQEEEGVLNAPDGSQEWRYVLYTPKVDSRSRRCKDVGSTDTSEGDVKRPHSNEERDNVQREQRFIFIPQSDPSFYASFAPEERETLLQGVRDGSSTKPTEKLNAVPKLDTRLNNTSAEYNRSSSQHSSTDGSRSDGIRRNTRSPTGGIKSPVDMPSTPAMTQQNRGRHSNADSTRDSLAPTPPPKPDKYKPPAPQPQPGESSNDGKQTDSASPSSTKSRRRRSGRYSFVGPELPQINTLGIRTDSTDAQENKREPAPPLHGNPNTHQVSSNTHPSTFQQVPRKSSTPSAFSQQPPPYPISPRSPPPQQVPDWQPRINTNPSVSGRIGSSTSPSPLPYPPRSPPVRPNQKQGPRNYPPGSPQGDGSFPTPLAYPQPLRSPVVAARDGLWPSDPITSPRLTPAKHSTASPSAVPGKPEFPLFLACARSAGVSGKNDWHSLINCANFNVCPTCLEDYIVSSPFSAYFRPSTRPSDMEIKCDFSNIWVRTAWNFTLQQRRQNLDLFHSVAKVITSMDPCPGDTGRTGPWHSILDPDTGEPVEDFDMCRSCVSNIEALFPTISGVFVAIPGRQGQERVCDMRAGSKRFPKYFRMIESTADAARVSFRPPETRVLAHFVQKRSSMRECTNDRLVFDKAWHTIPEIPHFTICEECYNDVVWPAIDGGSTLASKCSRSMQLVWSENEGVSCQLYSQRMRQIFEEAVTRNDLDFLKKKAFERRDKEVTVKKKLNHMLQTYASQLHNSKTGNLDASGNMASAPCAHGLHPYPARANNVHSEPINRQRTQMTAKPQPPPHRQPGEAEQEEREAHAIWPWRLCG
ncbi:hypothetical protein GP486_003446 [Trichoglossum hirsutum]|uniref:Uncharacterized protein n=1 Tax=Trichoglossum hirsutum TaxID=265104 RepID=A0A9P8LD36_9PEZI|nr:hypothetical protein GP486_003446 [Trichoglossum hirsutum]